MKEFHIRRSRANSLQEHSPMETGGFTVQLSTSYVLRQTIYIRQRPTGLRGSSQSRLSWDLQLSLQTFMVSEPLEDWTIATVLDIWMIFSGGLIANWANKVTIGSQNADFQRFFSF